MCNPVLTGIPASTVYITRIIKLKTYTEYHMQTQQVIVNIMHDKAIKGILYLITPVIQYLNFKVCF